MLQRDSDVVQAFQQPPAHVVINDEVRLKIAHVDLLGLQIDRDLGARLGLQVGPDLLDDVLLNLCSDQPTLACVAAEDVGEARGHDHFEAVVGKRPHGMFA